MRTPSFKTLSTMTISSRVQSQISMPAHTRCDKRMAHADHVQLSHRTMSDRNKPKKTSDSRLLEEYFRTPASLLTPLFTERHAEQAGYFNLGSDTVCYGKVSTEKAAGSPNGALEDLLPSAHANGSGVAVHFDADEAVENLRRERYTAHFREEGSVLNELIRKAYYLVRPLLGVPVRRHLQKIHLRGWENIAFPAWPVDTTVERIHKKLLALSMRAQGVERVPFIWFWPEGHSSCLIMTHDVEDVAGKDFCSKLMDLDESAGLRSSFQIVPEDRYVVTRDFLDSIKCRGFEVNVHDLKHDGRLYAEHDEFLRRAKCINSYARQFGAEGFRSGILYRNADWYSAFDFSYDMSIPNVGHLDPQRGGCCTVMPYFIGNIVELPLTCTQDYTLLQIMSDYSIDLWKRQIGIIHQNNGLISFIVHPDYVIKDRAQAVYKELLGHLSELRSSCSIWSPLPRDAAAWWRQRSEMSLTCEGGCWRVVGPGAERARVAFANLDGESVTYQLADKSC